MGLLTVPQSDIEQGHLDAVDNERVFVRTHGVSQRLMQVLEAHSSICDGTCPTVKKIQHKIRDFHNQGYQVIIYGKPDHPEVKGLNGYCDDKAIIVTSVTDARRISFAQKAVLLSQTTMARDQFDKVKQFIEKHAPQVKIYDTLCRQVVNRHEILRNFARSVDVLLLVGGKKSSNTKVLYNIAKQSNPKSHWIQQPSDIHMTWFDSCQKIGVSGSASTPLQQLQQVKQFLDGITFH
jgi:4-hydroxy-3-methylbut-2-enyl diphosphate reductase